MAMNPGQAQPPVQNMDPQTMELYRRAIMMRQQQQPQGGGMNLLQMLMQLRRQPQLPAGEMPGGLLGLLIKAAQMGNRPALPNPGANRMYQSRQMAQDLASDPRNFR